MTQPEYIAKMKKIAEGGERMVPSVWTGDLGVIGSHFSFWHRIARMLTAGVSTLDVGCGYGLGSRIYSIATGAEVYAIDRPEVIELTQELTPTPGVIYVGHNLSKPFTFNRIFGNIICCDVLEHLDNDGFINTLVSMRKVSDSSTKFICCVPIHANAADDKCQWHLRHWSSKEAFLNEVGQCLPKSQVLFP